MKNTIRCCISCILPCGALDVIRIVHANGRVEEISGSVKAEEIMKAHPKHVLKKPSSSSSSGDQDHDHRGMCPKIVIVPPDAELQRGKIYFLMPLPSNSSEKTSSHNPMKKKSKLPSSTTATTTKPRSSSTPSSNNNNNYYNSSSTRRKKRELAVADHHHHDHDHHNHHRQSSIGRNNHENGNGNGNSIPVDNFLISDRYLSEILSEKVSTQRDRRRGRAGVWRPHLESISESITSTPGPIQFNCK